MYGDAMGEGVAALDVAVLCFCWKKASPPPSLLLPLVVPVAEDVALLKANESSVPLRSLSFIVTVVVLVVVEVIVVVQMLLLPLLLLLLPLLVCCSNGIVKDSNSEGPADDETI